MSASHVSALVCTKNRGSSATMTARSILANTYPDFELIIVDQSTDDETERSLREFLADPRFRYIRSATSGLGRAHNLGLSMARGAVVAITDDDCTVPPNWLQVFADVFRFNPRVAVAFCNVVAAEHDPAAGFVPAYQRSRDALVRNFVGRCRARGIGAGMAVRRASVLDIGGFDEELGPGARFPSYDDCDIALRAIARGYWVYETAAVGVMHYGYRTFEQGKLLTQRDWTAIGAAHSKYVRAGHLGALVVMLYELLYLGLLRPFGPLLRGRRPRGLRRVMFFAKGFVAGLRTPIDRRQLVFRPIDAAGASEQWDTGPG